MQAVAPHDGVEQPILAQVDQQAHKLLGKGQATEQVVAAAARLCYSSASIGELMEKSKTDRQEFLEKIEFVERTAKDEPAAEEAAAE